MWLQKRHDDASYRITVEIMQFYVYWHAVHGMREGDL